MRLGDSTGVSPTPRKRKFMQSIGTATYKELERIAEQNSVTIQELLRAVIIPEWLKENRKERE